MAIGGYNDGTGNNASGVACTKAMVKTEISKFIKTVRAHFPNANIVIGAAGWHVNNTGIQNNLDSIAVSAYKEAANEFGAYYVDGIENVLRNNTSYFSNDGLHPSVAGQNAIATAVANYIRTQATAASSSSVTGDYSSLSVGSDNGVHLSNKEDFPYHSNDDADPYMIKDGDTYYIYVTNNTYYTTKDFKTWSGPKTAIVSGIPSGVNYHWAPEVYKIGNTYYMLSSFIKWGSGYPFCSNSEGFVGVSKTTDLSQGFTYWKKIDSKISQLSNITSNCGGSDTNHNNLNFIDGNLLIDGSKYYLYYKAEFNQQIYGIELDSSFNTISTKPSNILSKGLNDGWGNGVAEGPMVWKHHGYYSMMYSSGNYKGDEGPNNIYAVGYAWSSNPLSGWTNQSVSYKTPFFFGADTFPLANGSYGGYSSSINSRFLAIYAPGHNAIFQVSNDNTNNLSEWYNVYHSAYHDTNYNYVNRKLNVQRMGTSDGAVYTNGVSNDYQPLISGTTYNGNVYNQLRTDSMTVTLTNNQNQTIISDGAIYNATSGVVTWSTPKAKSVSEVTITLNNRMDLSDIWLASGGENFDGNSATVYINESNGRQYYFTVTDMANLLGNAKYKKLQLPSVTNSESKTAVEGGYKKIRIKFGKTVNLTEITPIRRGTTNYNEVKYTISFNGNGGSNGTAITGKSYGSNLGTLPSSTRTGYTFKGWYTATSGGSQISSTTKATGSTTYYAQWTKNSYQLTINPNGGSYGGSTGNSSFTLSYQDTKTISNPTRTGYVFDGWNLSSGDSSLSGTTFTMGSSNATLTAKWKSNVYTLTINPNGGIYKGSSNNTTVSLEYNATTTIDTPTRDGYSFAGWDVTGGVLTGTTFKQTTYGASLLKAKWNPNSYTYTVRHELMNLDGTSYTLESTTGGSANIGERVTPPVKTYTGFDSPSTQTIVISSNSSNTVTYRYNRKKYKITIQYGDKNNRKEEKQVFYEDDLNLTIPNNDGYRFDKWTTTAGTLTGNKLHVTNTATVTGKWKVIPYTISYEFDGGTYPGTLIYEYNIESNDIKLLDAKKNGYKFVGYSPNNNGTLLENNTIKKGSYGNLVLYAKFSISAYSLTIDPNGGTYDGSSEKSTFNLEYNDSKTIVAPVRTGYTFTGWEITGAGSSISNGVFVMGYENAMIKAKWSSEKYSVKIDPNGGLYDEKSTVTLIDMNYMDSITLKTPTREGYTFAGFEADGGIISGNQFLLNTNSTVTITAKWIVNNYNYIIYHKQMGLDGVTYALVETESGTANYGDKVSGTLKNYDGFITPSKKTITVTEGGNNVIEYLYERKKFSVTIKNGDGKEKTEKKYYQEIIHLSPFDREGYNFLGWTTTDGVLDGNSLTVMNDCVVEASFEPVNYVLTFVLDGGNTSQELIHSYNYTMEPIKIENPVKEGYYFVAWRDSTGKIVKDLVISGDQIKNGNVVYFAVWSTDTIVPVPNTSLNVSLLLKLFSIGILCFGLFYLYKNLSHKNTILSN